MKGLKAKLYVENILLLVLLLHALLFQTEFPEELLSSNIARSLPHILADFPFTCRFSRCSYSIARNSTTHSLINSSARRPVALLHRAPWASGRFNAPRVTLRARVVKLHISSFLLASRDQGAGGSAVDTDPSGDYRTGLTVVWNVPRNVTVIANAPPFVYQTIALDRAVPLLAIATAGPRLISDWLLRACGRLAVGRAAAWRVRYQALIGELCPGMLVDSDASWLPCVVMLGRLLRADKDEVREYGEEQECKGCGNGKSSRKPAGQWQRLLQFPHAKIRERPRPGIEPGSLGGRRVVWPLHHRGPLGPCMCLWEMHRNITHRSNGRTCNCGFVCEYCNACADVQLRGLKKIENEDYRASSIKKENTRTPRIYFCRAGFSRVGIGPDDAAGRLVLSGISRFSRPYIPALLHTHLASPSSALRTSMLRCYDGNTAHLARRSDEAQGVRVTVVHIAPSLLDLGRAATQPP
ncbi:hypothetical protein PR048_021426 [Dryococelus australis]|uniref:Uncharacterized protein n=1 Tax=Dryococelus australis TaxID=614101 RepID=A0ABQ9GY83_9NEOP|nr:hypothetical protein PR048_021426 [Dryococelus australis]